MALIYEPKGRAREYAPLATNIYRGCSHLCRYCYAPDCLFTSRGAFGVVHERPDFLRLLEIEAKKLTPIDGRILLCFTCDPYPDGIDTTTTRETINILHRYGHRVQILTKGGLRSCRDFDLLGRGDAYAATLTLLDPEDAAYQEPGAALPQERMNALQVAHRKGIETWASMEPVLDPAQSLELIKYTSTYVDFYKVGKLNSQKTMPADLKALAKSIDWAKFARDAVTLLDSLGKRYYIKDDLRAYLEVKA